MTRHYIFGYGSLINTASLHNTVPDANIIGPAYIKGYRRAFTMWDAEGFTHSNPDLHGMPYCALNIAPSYANDRVNGILFAVSAAYYTDLIHREHDYSLVPTNAYDFATDELIGKCLVFMSSKNTGSFDSNNPAQQRYLDICLDGAREYGSKFYDEFQTNTYVGNSPLCDMFKTS